MAMEKSLVQKLYYENLFEEAKGTDHPVKKLGELYFTEQKKEIPDLSNIRFAQGEVYFHNNDFETAIFKWENIQNELEPWAKKNMADAYFELDILETAENLYQSIKTESLVLNTEVALQLFSLYLTEQRIKEADQMIKNAVILNPDYPNVTKLARAFYEEQNDWNSAVELSVNEAVRTSSLNWFINLGSYVEKGYTKTMEPAYFMQALSLLPNVDIHLFETILVDLWHSYEEEDHYLSWINEVTKLILHEDFNYNFQWRHLPSLYQEVYMDLIDGKHYISELQNIIPELLKAWIKITDSSTAFSASASLLAWADIFPESMDEYDKEKAMSILKDADNNANVLEEGLQFFQLIRERANEQKMNVDIDTAWMIHCLADINEQYVAFGGSFNRDKDQIIASIIGSEAVHSMPGGEMIVYRHDMKTTVQLISDNSDVIFDAKSINEDKSGIIEVRSPNIFLNENQLAVIDLPHFDWTNAEQLEIPDTLRLADRLVFMLNANAPFTNNEREMLMNIKEQIPELHIDFILNTRNNFSETKQVIHTYFPDAHLFEQWDAFMHVRDNKKDKQLRRTTKVLFFIRKVISHMLHQQVKVEEALSKLIERNEDVLTKLQGSIHQLHDIEEEKIRLIEEAYQAFKLEIKADLEKTIPTLIKESSDIMKDDSDFRRIHLDLNEEMNKRIESYIQNTVMPTYTSSLQDWITYAQTELQLSQEQLQEWETGFNALLGNERVTLHCDFQIINDWKRDADRMTSSIQVEKENILLRRTPSQVLLKGAGRLLGVLPKNNAMLANTYKNFIENESFDETAKVISVKFFRQFEIFEKAISRDIHIFYREPFSELKQTVEEIDAEMTNSKDELAKMHANPEVFHDPLTLFDLRLRQYEWMNYAEQVKIDTP